MKAPESLRSEFDGRTQKDWIIYDEDHTRLFCIAVWVDEKRKWVLGEYVSITDPDDVLDVAEKGYMTMLEAARWRTNYSYVIARYDFDLEEDVVGSEYWQGLVPGLSNSTDMESPHTPIDIREFESAMAKLVKDKDIVWQSE